MSSTDAPTVHLERDGGILTVTFDREQKRNAVDDALRDAADQLSADPTARALIISGLDIRHVALLQNLRALGDFQRVRLDVTYAFKICQRPECDHSKDSQSPAKHRYRRR